MIAPSAELAYLKRKDEDYAEAGRQMPMLGQVYKHWLMGYDFHILEDDNGQALLQLAEQGAEREIFEYSGSKGLPLGLYQMYHDFNTKYRSLTDSTLNSDIFLELPKVERTLVYLKEYMGKAEAAMFGRYLGVDLNPKNVIFEDGKISMREPQGSKMHEITGYVSAIINLKLGIVEGRNLNAIVSSFNSSFCESARKALISKFQAGLNGHGQKLRDSESFLKDYLGPLQYEKIFTEFMTQRRAAIQRGYLQPMAIAT